MNKPRKHHFLPVFYLKGFSDNEGYLFQFSKSENEIKKKRPKQVGFRKDFHTFLKEDGEKDFDFIENYYNKYIGNPTSKIMTKLNDKNEITNEERSNFSRFVVNVLTRTPRYRKSLKKYFERHKLVIRDVG